MKIFRYLGIALCTLCLCPGLTACDDEDGILKTALPTPDASNDGATYNSLSFRWNKIPGATQYGYRLKSGDGTEIASDVTSGTELTFTGLQPDTPYTLEVWAYGKYDSADGTSETLALNARTLPLTKLDKPVVTVTPQGNSFVASWDAVAGAESYKVTVTDAEAGTEIRSVDQEETSYTISGLNTGTYNVSVRAVTAQEGYLDSDPCVVQLIVTHVAQWTVKGTYTTADGKSWAANMTYYGDGEYTIENWYGTEGYDFTFYNDPTNTEDMFSLSDQMYDYDESTGYFWVPGGPGDNDGLWVYPWYNYSGMTGDRSYGEVTIYTSEGTVDKYTWGNPDAPKVTIDDMAGSWTLALVGELYYDSWEDISDTSTVTATKVSDTQIELNNFLWEDVPAVITLDLEARTATIKPQDYYGYTLCGATVNDPVTGTISEDFKTITLPGWNLFYDGASYTYECSATLTR